MLPVHNSCASVYYHVLINQVGLLLFVHVESRHCQACESHFPLQDSWWSGWPGSCLASEFKDISTYDCPRTGYVVYYLALQSCTVRVHVGEACTTLPGCTS